MILWGMKCLCGLESFHVYEQAVPLLRKELPRTAAPDINWQEKTEALHSCLLFAGSWEHCDEDQTAAVSGTAGQRSAEHREGREKGLLRIRWEATFLSLT